MGEGDKRTRRTARYDSRELALLSRKQSPTEADWDEKIAAGSQKLPVAPLEARTTTVDDPLTTSLLAEVARRHTVEVDPDDIDEAIDVAPDDLGSADLLPGETDPTDPR
jgi:hypothetical protein